MVEDKDAIDLGFHDDELINLELDFQKKTATLTIKTFLWEEFNDSTVKGKAYRAKPDKIVKLYLELEEKGGRPVFEGDWEPVIPDTILWAYISNSVLSITLVMGYFEFWIKSYKRVGEGHPEDTVLCTYA